MESSRPAVTTVPTLASLTWARKRNPWRAPPSPSDRLQCQTAHAFERGAIHEVSRQILKLLGHRGFVRLFAEPKRRDSHFIAERPRGGSVGRAESGGGGFGRLRQA